MLPWVSSKREQLKDPDELFPYGDPMADDYLKCEPCMARCTRSELAAMACGWIPKGERDGSEFLHPEGAPDVTVCPGYTTTLPQVIEASRALSWRQDGQLSDFYDGERLTDAVRDAMDIMASEVKAVERHALRKTKAKQKGHD